MINRQIGSVTLEYALANYPRVIVCMKLNKLEILTSNTCDGNDVAEVYDKTSREFHLIMNRGDLDKCIAIAKLMTIPLFSSDTELDMLDKASAYINQYFA